MDSRHVTPFERSLMETVREPVEEPGGEAAPVKGDPLLGEALESCQRLSRTLAVRRQIDGFLGSAGRLDEIGALLLTVVTAGHLFAYNRAFLLLKDPESGRVEGSAGIGNLSREEAWQLWARILEEGADLDHLVREATENFREHNERLAPLLDRLAVDPGQEDESASSFMAQSAAVLSRNGLSEEGRWLLEALGAEEVGVVPMWGHQGHFGVLLVDNFASGRALTSEGVKVLESFVKPFISALEKAIIIERYRTKVAQLQEAKARIEAQQEMLIRMERKNTVGRFTATLAHNLLNPVLSLSGHLGRLRRSVVGNEKREKLVTALLQDARDLEEFLGDFVSQVQEEVPQRHYWDLNHIIVEVISFYRRFHNVATPSIQVTEGDVPLVWVDYEVVTDALSRLMGVLDLLLGGLDGLRMSTSREDSSVRLTLAAGDTLPAPPQATAGEVGREIERLREYLAREEVGLEQGADGFVLVFRI